MRTTFIKTALITVESIANIEPFCEVLCWDGCEWAIDHVDVDVDADTGERYMSEGTEVVAYIKLPTPEYVATLTKPKRPEHIKRMETERNDLLTKIHKLQDFIEASELYPTLDREEREELKAQLDAMHVYEQTLALRLERHLKTLL